MIKASEIFTVEEIEKIKFILNLFNGRIVAMSKEENIFKINP
jgi:hypothetical protein